mmetsp:Transcript_36933/g.92804  ORF Transcript_36933/g.92804 Transcript_36933/m.92804 type:complete len:110 (-) Transcript_36933:6635-6964(-)
MLQEMVSAGVQSRSEAKKSILKVLNGGCVSNVDTPWWENLCTEFGTLACQVATHPDHKFPIPGLFATHGLTFPKHIYITVRTVLEFVEVCIRRKYKNIFLLNVSTLHPH